MAIDSIIDSIVQSGRGSHPAFVLEDGTNITYAELLERVEQASNGLKSKGLRPGHRMLLVGENSLQMVVALLGAIRAGAWAVPVNARMSMGEIHAISAHCEPRFSFWDTAGSEAAFVHAAGKSDETTSSDFLGGRLASHDTSGVAPDASPDVALMIYTSGSTGLPKGVMLTNSNIQFVMEASRGQSVLLPEDVAFHALPISHSFGLVSALLCGLHVGATLHLVTRFSAARLGEAISSGTITVFQGVPAMYARLHEWQTQTGRSVQPNRLRLAYIGGSHVDATRKSQAESMLGVQLHQGYGLTESAPAATRTIGHPAPMEITAGWPIPGIEVVVQDGAGTNVEAGVQGEICIRGPNVMLGYFRAPDQTHAAIDERAWLHTGDIGYFSPSGDLQIVGRSKELIIRGGFNVYPAEVERAIAAFPGVAQCAVVGRQVPDDEEVVAFIEPIAGQSLELDLLHSFLRDRLAPYKIPSDVRVIDRLPATPTGKLLKTKLKDIARTTEHRLPAKLSKLLAPRSVAIVGASDNPHKVGGRPVGYLLKSGYAGRIYPVNPRAQTIQGLKAYGSLSELPEVPEAVVLCVNSEQAEEQVALCASLKVPTAILLASSYAEVGEEGLQRQDRLAQICRASGLQLIGPNTIGVANFDSGAILSFASIYSDHDPMDGPIAIVSQSGAFGVSAYALLRQAGCGVRCVAATGNEAAVDTADFIHELANSPDLSLILLYIENVPDPVRMTAALKAAQRNGVTVMTVRAGRSSDGRRSAQLHTGSAGAAGTDMDAIFQQCGCLTLSGVAELVQSALLHMQVKEAAKHPASTGRLAIVSNSGASCVLAADEAAAAGMALAVLSPSSNGELDEMLPDFSLNRNPIDLTAMLLADTSLLGRAVQVALNDEAVDAVVLGLLAIGGPSYDVPRFVRDTLDAQRISGKPLAFHSPHPHVRQAFFEGGVATFESESAAIYALQRVLLHRAAAATEARRTYPSPQATAEKSYA